MEKAPKNIIAILCGGTGPRLWPLSRASFPKQFLSIFSAKSLLQETYDRSTQIVPKENIYIVTNSQFLDEIKQQLPKINPKNIIAEPQKKNTALALLYLSSIVAKDNPNNVITSLPADHHISNLKSFSKSIKQAQDLTLSSQKITLIGKKPTFPNPSYGYIIGKPTSHQYFEIKSFVEKPKGTQLQKIFNNGGLWNLGIYTFTPKILLQEISHTQKQLYPIYNLLFSDNVKASIVDKVYKKAPNLPIDIAISEVSKNLLAIEAKFDWSDIGEWGSIFKALPKNKSNIKSIGIPSTTFTQNSSNCLVSTTGKKVIGLNGVSNLAIIDTPDAILVSNLDDSFHIRELVGQIVASKATAKYFLTKNDPKSK